jgi:hypothetical protein
MVVIIKINNANHIDILISVLTNKLAYSTWPNSAKCSKMSGTHCETQRVFYFLKRTVSRWDGQKNEFLMVFNFWNSFLLCHLNINLICSYEITDSVTNSNMLTKALFCDRSMFNCVYWCSDNASWGSKPPLKNQWRGLLKGYTEFNLLGDY